ncbi:hypothetical protein [Allochromatium palmeri]|uniref:Uncharacterized protein n=1 Tax=Allochromatium palmeri TaxID=231048 RepID=A0A6N8EFD7_9GAMM|nr:hypothetical protein [Allochromatium palmeri]MTW22943.1 hypothetical protein [Allochromatium palmeri]
MDLSIRGGVGGSERVGQSIGSYDLRRTLDQDGADLQERRNHSGVAENRVVSKNVIS